MDNAFGHRNSILIDISEFFTGIRCNKLIFQQLMTMLVGLNKLKGKSTASQM